ncbi:MAG TPA: SNF2-related protein [Kofleriaceae bacterium]|nr:SNF2-related protein [Kofleriaceae bacterium]
MGELGVVQHPPYCEEAAEPILQWAHLIETPRSGPVPVQFANQGGARVTHFARGQLPAGATVLIPRARLIGVVMETPDSGRSYSVRTRRGLLRSVPSDAIWPISSGPPAPGGLDAAIVTARTLLHVGNHALTGLRTNSPARWRLLWRLERFLAICEQDGLGGAAWVDAALLPHQIGAVAAVVTSPSVRHLLTDEVGLGKTIEAIMIWSALRSRDPQLTTLVAVPRTLVPQWCFEYQRRAERRVKADWYEGLPRIFVPESETSLEVLDAPDPGRPVITDHAALERVTELPLDMLIIDESHLLNAKQRAAVSKLADKVKHLLLLTGTPRDARRKVGIRVKAKTDELTPFLWALRLVDPKIGPDAEAGEVVRRLEEALELGALSRDALAGKEGAAASFVATSRKLLATENAGTPAFTDIAQLAAEVARRATVFERVVRTRRRNVSRDTLCERRLERTRVEPRDEELEILREVSKVNADETEERVAGEERTRRAVASSWKALSARPYSDQRVRSGVAALGGIDSKLEALCDLLGEIWHRSPERKVVLRAAYGETRQLIFNKVRSLLLDGGLRPSSDADLEAWTDDDSIGPVALVQDSSESLIELLRRFSTGGKRPAEMDLRATMLAQLRAFENFRDGGACLLVANDQAGTGLNLQHASDLVLYDLPWRPQITEQWIGRLDRLGRRGSNPVRIHVLSHPEAPDWDLIELYEALGLFGDGFHVPPEIASEIDGLIDRADAGLIGWPQAINDARTLLARADSGQTDDVLLELTEPNRDLGTRLIARSFDVDGSTPTVDVLESLADVGFGVERDPDGDGVVRLTMTRDVLALREVRQVLRPPQSSRPGKGRDPMAAPPRLNVDTKRLPFGTALRAQASQFLSPQHPLITELRHELDLDAGASVGVFELECLAGLERLVNKWVACALTRSYPSAAAMSDLWSCGAFGLSSDLELQRVCEIVEAALARMLTFAIPPRTQSHGRVVVVEGGQFRLTEQSVAEEHVELMIRSLGSKRARAVADIPTGIDSTLAEFGASMRGAAADVDLSNYSRDLSVFITYQRRDVLSRRKRVLDAARSRARVAKRAAEEAEAALQQATAVFEKLANVAKDLPAIAQAASRSWIVAAALIAVRA